MLSKNTFIQNLVSLMKKPKKSILDCKSLWESHPGTVTAKKDLDLILGSVTNLPLQYWRPFFLFFRAKDKDLLKITKNRFPAKLENGKTHPVFALQHLPNNVGFKVCPCSSKKPFYDKTYRYIKENTTLKHTGYMTDRNSFLVESVRFNMPATIAGKMLFKGEVPEDSIVIVNAKRKYNGCRE